MNVPPDVVPPALVCPTNLLVGVYAWQTSRPVQFDATATDDLDPTPVVTCEPPSGATFALGQTRVICAAQDASSNVTQCSFTVTVEAREDHTPPSLSCSPVWAFALGGAAPTVEFTPTVTDDLDLAPAVVCEPPSGSVFPIGSTLVTCVARDLASNTAECSFAVQVSPVWVGWPRLWWVRFWEEGTGTNALLRFEEAWDPGLSGPSPLPYLTLRGPFPVWPDSWGAWPGLLVPFGDVPAIAAFYGVWLAAWTGLLWPQVQARPLVWGLTLLVALAQVAWHVRLIADRSRDGCFRAFRANHWLGFTVFAGTALSLG